MFNGRQRKRIERVFFYIFTFFYSYIKKNVYFCSRKIVEPNRIE